MDKQNPEFMRWLKAQPVGYLEFLYNQYLMSQQVNIIVMPDSAFKRLDSLSRPSKPKRRKAKIITEKEITQLEEELETNGLKHLTDRKS